MKAKKEKTKSEPRGNPNIVFRADDDVQKALRRIEKALGISRSEAVRAAILAADKRLRLKQGKQGRSAAAAA